MALSNLPTVWSAQALTALRANLVFAGKIANRDYEGTIRQGGDTVKIRGLADPTIFDVTRNSDIPAPETLSDSVISMVIDQAKGFNFQVDDLDQLQKVGGRSVQLESTQNAGIKLAEATDAVVAAALVAAVPAGSANNIGTTAAPVTIDVPAPGATLTASAIDAYRLISRIAVKLDKLLVPQQGRWIVLPPFMLAALANDQRFTAAGGAGVIATNGYQGKVAGFDIYSTTLVPSPASTKYQVLAGYRGSVSYADQLIETVFYRPERRFADAVKGVHVFGVKVVRPATTVMATIQDVSGLDA